jgi:hypothetical protein
MSNDLVSKFEGDEDGRSFERILKFSNEGKFVELDGTLVDTSEQYVAYATTKRLRRWEDKIPVYLPPVEGERLQDTADRLNEAIPKAEWPLGLTNQPEPPIKPVYGVKLLRPRDGALFVFEHDTTGQKIAVGELTQQINVTRTLRGEVLPIVKLQAKSWKTGFGMRLRPHYEILEYRSFGGGGAGEINGGGDPSPQIEPPKGGSGGATEQIGKPVKPVTIQEELNDSINF